MTANYHPTKIFTMEQANKCLPLVRVIASDMVALAADLVERQRRLEQLTAGRDRDSSDVYREELAQIEEELEKDVARLNGFLEEIRQLGAEPKDPVEGLIDFPAMMEDRLVFLCWKFDEPEIHFWHELDAGFEGRQALASATT